MYQTIMEAVLGHAQETPEKPAVCFKRQKLTYRELAHRVAAGARLLREKWVIESGDIVMVSALSKPEYVAAHLAVQYLGAAVAPVDKSALEESVTSLYHFVMPKLFLTDSRISDGSVRKASLREWYAETEGYPVGEIYGKDFPYRLPDMDSMAEIIFTSGTSGRPKGAMLSYRSILAGTCHTRDGVERTSDDVELIPLPLNHSFGLRVLRTVLYIGATAVLQNGFMFSKELETNLDQYNCTGISIVPASAERLYRSLGDRFTEVFARFKHLEVSAGSLSVGMKQKLLTAIPQVHIYNVWGSSETGGVIFLDVTEHPEHIASLGLPIEGVEIRMLDGDGEKRIAHSVEEAGRMVMRGAMQMQGYYRQPDVTAETIMDGWLYTGDLVYQTADGYIYMLGRADDIINVGGEKVSPIEVENMASQYDGIRECACVGGDDPEGVFGQIPVLFVVPEGAELDEDAVTRFLSTRIEQYKLPKKYILVDEIPRNRMKKVDRKRLRQMLKASGAEKTERNSVVSAIYGRRSIRDFQEKRIPKELLEQIVECGCQAPSGHNMQTWRFTVVRNHDEIARIKETIKPIARRNRVYFYGFNNPDALILISNDMRNPDGIQDSSCAAQNIMLAAHSYGIGSVWINALMKVCGEPEVRMMLEGYGIPESHNVWAMIALGYPANRPAGLAKKRDVVRWVE